MRRKEIKNMFKRGNVVRFRCGFRGEKNDPCVGKLGVIDHGDDNGYMVYDMETGSLSGWWYKGYLKFVSEGSEEEVIKCEMTARAFEEKARDLEYIKKIFKNKGKLSEISLLTLFNEIGYQSSFVSNGEFFCLSQDWYTLCPIFKAIFNEDYEGMIEALKVFKEEYREKYTVKAIKLYNKINS